MGEKDRESAAESAKVKASSVKVLAISGKRFVGKDTLAGLLLERAEARGRPLLRVALADESKQAFVEAEAAEGRQVDLERLKVERAYKEAVRPRLTRYTEEALARDPHVFCKRALSRPAPEGYAALLLTDLRLAGDAAFLRSFCDAYLVRLRCDDAVRAGFGWRRDDSVDNHWTETDLDGYTDWDAVVVNPGDLPGFGQVADRVLDGYFASPRAAP